MWIIYPKMKCGNCGKIEEKCGKNPHFLPLFLHSDVTDGERSGKFSPQQKFPSDGVPHHSVLSLILEWGTVIPANTCYMGLWTVA